MDILYLNSYLRISDDVLPDKPLIRSDWTKVFFSNMSCPVSVNVIDFSRRRLGGWRHLGNFKAPAPLACDGGSP
ncbi:hypothetical protein RHECNPAF_930062 [Rhizobium etli CNPAF512]|nr:hypothetical protein RHECNPAF_930062 [Rhizobium etli CNPAF512]